MRPATRFQQILFSPGAELSTRFHLTPADSSWSEDSLPGVPDEGQKARVGRCPQPACLEGEGLTLAVCLIRRCLEKGRGSGDRSGCLSRAT